jgi:hypothetical protein
MGVVGVSCGTDNPPAAPPKFCDASSKTLDEPQFIPPGEEVSATISVDIRLECVSGGTPVAVTNDTIIWVVTAGGGAPTVDDTTLTDKDGVATTQWTMGPGVGFQSITARSTGTESHTFTTVAFGHIAISAGDHQTAAPGQPLPDSLEVLYTDGTGAPVAGQAIEWSTGIISGSMAPQSSLTGANGKARSQWTLGSGTPTESATAAVNLGFGGGPSVNFAATAAGAPPVTCASPGGKTEVSVGVSTTWTKADNPHLMSSKVSVLGGAVLTIEPGALVCAGPHVLLEVDADNSGAKVMAVGTAAEPIRFEAADPAINWTGMSITGPTQLTWTRIDRADRAVFAGMDAVIDHTLVTRYGDIGIWLAGFNRTTGLVTGSITNSIVEHYAGPTNTQNIGIYLSDTDAGFVIHHVSVQAAGAIGILIRGSVSLSDCDVSFGSGVGISLQSATPLTVSNCNFVNNVGNGVESNGSVANAQGNWWGDAAGPTGPNGDGIGPSVDASNFLAAPAALGAFPAPPVRARVLGAARSRAATAESRFRRR